MRGSFRAGGEGEELALEGNRVVIAGSLHRGPSAGHPTDWHWLPRFWGLEAVIKSQFGDGALVSMSAVFISLSYI